MADHGRQWESMAQYGRSCIADAVFEEFAKFTKFQLLSSYALVLYYTGNLGNARKNNIYLLRGVPLLKNVGDTRMITMMPFLELQTLLFETFITTNNINDHSSFLPMNP